MICAVEECSRAAIARGWCDTHYRIWKRNGDPTVRKPRRGTLTHGNSPRGSATKEYVAWKAMRQRCHNPNVDCYVNYGGRGISVCSEWRAPKSGFLAFLRAMGPAPSPGHTVDRIDNDGDYEPGNCHWATRSEQMRNTRRSKLGRNVRETT